MIAAGCGGLLSFGADNEETLIAEAAAPSADGSRGAEGGFVVDGSDVGNVSVDATSDGRVCLASGNCAQSVFDCCSEMADPSAALCAGLCGVNICCN